MSDSTAKQPSDWNQLPHWLRQIEARRGSRVLVLAASNLDMELLPPLFDELNNAFGQCKRLDVLIRCRGGEIHAARRIALLLRRFCEDLHFIVPHYCESAATLMCLAADQVIAGELAIFTPIDPQLNAGNGEQSGSISSQDIALFGRMCADWFGVDESEAKRESLSLMAGSLFAPGLTAFYRCVQEVEMIGLELAQWHLPQATQEQRLALVRQLINGYHSHHYPLSGDDLQKLGMHIQRDAHTEALAWQVARLLAQKVGGGLRQHAREEYCDALLAHSKMCMTRVHGSDGMLGQWTVDKWTS
jgi:Serine dehydrogenase proteinase